MSKGTTKSPGGPVKTTDPAGAGAKGKPGANPGGKIAEGTGKGPKAK